MIRSWGWMRAVKVAKLAVEPELRNSYDKSQFSVSKGESIAMRNVLRLNVDTPGLVLEVESLESTLLAENFELVDNLVTCEKIKWINYDTFLVLYQISGSPP